MDKRLKNALAYLLLTFSVMFCCVSVMSSAYAYRNENGEEFKPIDNISVKTVSDKIEQVERVDKQQLEYEKKYLKN